MPIVDPDHIACFECVEVVHPFTKDGVKHVACACCGLKAPIEDALDDCFVFIVAAAIAGRFAKNEARTYRFMPLQGTREAAIKDRVTMLRSGRARELLDVLYLPADRADQEPQHGEVVLGQARRASVRQRCL